MKYPSPSQSVQIQSKACFQLAELTTFFWNPIAFLAPLLRLLKKPTSSQQGGFDHVSYYHLHQATAKTRLTRPQHKKWKSQWLWLEKNSTSLEKKRQKWCFLKRPWCVCCDLHRIHRSWGPLAGRRLCQTKHLTLTHERHNMNNRTTSSDIKWGKEWQGPVGWLCWLPECLRGGYAEATRGRELESEIRNAHLFQLFGLSQGSLQIYRWIPRHQTYIGYAKCLRQKNNTKI